MINWHLSFPSVSLYTKWGSGNISHLPAWVWGVSWQRCCPWRLPVGHLFHQPWTSWVNKENGNNQSAQWIVLQGRVCSKTQKVLTHLSWALCQKSRTLMFLCPRHHPATENRCWKHWTKAQETLFWYPEVTSLMYSSRSRAFLKSYSLARLLSSQMYICKEKCRRGLRRDSLGHSWQFLHLGVILVTEIAPCAAIYGWNVAIVYLDEVMSAEHRHGVGVLLLLLQQLLRQCLLMQQEALLLNNVWMDRKTCFSD